MTSKFRFMGVFALVVVALLVTTMGMRSRIEAVEAGVDDANIFFVYARNLAAGHGLVWNVNGHPVEGFSSPLWLMLITPFFAITAHPGFLLFGLSVVLVSLALTVCIVAIADRPDAVNEPDQTQTPVLFALVFGWVLWCFAQPMFLCWTTLTLMETGLWSAVTVVATAITAGSVEHARSTKAPWALWAITPIVLLARPEGMMWAGILHAAHAAVAWLCGQTLRKWLGQTAISLLVYAGSLAVITTFRMLYFGYPLPNTYYAKVSPDRLYSLQMGWQYFLEFVRSQRALPLLAGTCSAGVLLFAATLLRALIIRIRANSKPLELDPSLLSAFVYSSACMAGLLAPILVGGDHFDGFRFYQPIWPLLPMPLIFFLRHLFGRLTRRIPILRTTQGSLLSAAAVLSLAAWFFAPDISAWKTIGRRRLVDEFRLARDGRLLGEALNRIFERDLPEVGAIAVGGVQFAYRGSVNDLMGLSNTEMAHHPGPRKGIKNHAAFSKDVFYAQQPPVVVPVVFPFRARDFIGKPMPRELANYLNNRWVLEPLQGLPRDPAFRERYTPALVSRADQPADECIAAFYRNDFLASLRTNDIYEVAAFYP